MAVFGGWRLTRTGILFVIGILVLGGLVTGGIFLVKNHGEAVRRDQAAKIAEQNLKDQSKVGTQPIATDSDNKTSTNSGSTQTNTNSGNNSNGANSSSTATTNTNTASTAANSGTTQLPETGIDDTAVLGRIVIVAILALSVAFYVSSRRAADRL